MTASNRNIRKGILSREAEEELPPCLPRNQAVQTRKNLRRKSCIPTRLCSGEVPPHVLFIIQKRGKKSIPPWKTDQQDNGAIVPCQAEPDALIRSPLLRHSMTDASNLRGVVFMTPCATPAPVSTKCTHRSNAHYRQDCPPCEQEISLVPLQLRQ